MPVFPEAPNSTPWQSVFFEQSILLSQIAGKILCKLQRPPETKERLFTYPNMFKPRLEHLGRQFHDELITFQNSLPPLMKEPNGNAGALIIALKVQNIKSM